MIFFSPSHTRLNQQQNGIPNNNKQRGEIVHQSGGIKKRELFTKHFCFHQSDPKHSEFVNYLNWYRENSKLLPKLETKGHFFRSRSYPHKYQMLSTFWRAIKKKYLIQTNTSVKEADGIAGNGVLHTTTAMYEDSRSNNSDGNPTQQKQFSYAKAP